ncbi:flap endonuclease GEN homolog 1 [Cololabis saira]|uniref:flap endonuclease GEN homolog 1 n=1 Tax=Cololabis saira TaxID=129043 RepID=UPI002AD3F8AF|nr:flap endonuclease GEN homolog 1 [Cololabis saira]
MGVNDLWSIVAPVRESVPLYSLGGKTLAVDLSLWVCEAQHVQGMMGRVTKPHLRNLFFRVSSLIQMGIKLVFVMEGEAPKLKAETMSKRTQSRHGGFKKASAPKSATNTSRGRFNAVLRECAEMLDYLGVPWVTAAGEAEAMCAYLDSQGLVDGCITNDGDAFLYGARTVYRNFNMNSKDPQVDCYQTSRVQTELYLSRENLVGLGILLGCDYIIKGVPGVGREQALKLIQTLQGQSLLQRFVQWKEENADVFDVAVKKVRHCNICQHPGSAKAHERGGCVFCDSQKFCQPHFFDHQCPCDWHRNEQTHQASSLEANIRRKTLASQQFPFTEIISEFLVPKDKPVSHFKKRQPNMLLMQNFALKKMEWPKHYTSGKVLALMTYTELVNRKYGRDVSCQIKPLRILKPRVRNAVACFEVIWTTPEHYVFPEDCPTEDQREVRTVEEETIFRLAFPEIVESYTRSKALAEENKKKKKKKPKGKKEKPCDVSEDVSDLLSQMTLQSSIQPQTLPASNKTEVLILDSPDIHKQIRKGKEDNRCPVNTVYCAESGASPSVSVVIDALHLSDIDWDTLSFTSSPTPQANHSTEQKKTTDRDQTQGENPEQEITIDVKQADSRSVQDLSYTECPLRDRVLMRNTNQAMNHNDVVSRHLNYDFARPETNSQGKHAQMSNKGSSDSNVSGGVLAFDRKEPLADRSQSVFSLQKKETEQQILAAEGLKLKSNCSKKKYKFISSALPSSGAAPEKCHSDPGQRNKKNLSALQTTKRSVCMSLCSSSEESDVENQQSGCQRPTKTKLQNKIKTCILDVPLKPLSVPKPTSAEHTRKLHITRPKSQSLVEKAGNTAPVSAENKCQEMQTAKEDEDVILQTPASPVAVLDSDDSVLCTDSPLPLAERLRLKFLK